MRRSLLLTLACLAACTGDLPPGLTGNTLVVDEDDAVTLTFTAADPNENAITFAVTTEPSNGTAVITGDSVTYTPNPDFNGDDAFEVTPTADDVDGPAARFTVTVTPRNDAPVPVAYTGSIDEDGGPLEDAVTADDIDSNDLTFSLLTPAELGELTMEPDGTFSYAPDANVTGTETLTFRVSDGIDDATGSMTLTIGAVDDAPVADAASFNGTEDTPLTGTLTGSDAEGSAVTIAIASDVSNGTLTLTNAATGAFTYDPDPNFAGSDSFTFTATADGVTSAPATVSLTIAAVDDAPIPASLTLATDEDGSSSTVLEATDVDSSTLTWRITSQGSLGVAELNGNTLSYTPDPNQFGTDSIGVTVSDGTTLVDATVAVTIAAVNDVPTVEDVTATLAEDQDVSGALPGDDLDGDTLTFTLVDDSPDGQILLEEDGLWSFSAADDFNGTTTFTFTASDGEATSELGTVTLTVTPVNDDPVATVDQYDAYANLDIDVPAELGLLVNDADIDGNDLSVVVETITTSAGGTASFNADGSFTYQIPAGTDGTDRFDYTVEDGEGGTTTGSVEIDLEQTVLFVDAAGDDSSAPSNLPVYTHIADAMADATSGDLVYVIAAEGSSYDSPEIVRAGVTLQGSGAALTAFGFDAVAASDRPVVSGDVDLQEGSTVGWLSFVDTNVPFEVDGDDVLIHDSDATGAFFGAVVEHERVTFRNVEIDAILVGIGVSDASDLVIEDTTITGAAQPIQASYNDQTDPTLTIDRVTITDSAVVGIQVLFRGSSSGGQVTMNDISVSGTDGDGVRVSFEHSNTLTEVPVVQINGGTIAGDYDHGVQVSGEDLGDGLLIIDGLTIGSERGGEPDVGIEAYGGQGGEMQLQARNLMVYADRFGIRIDAQDGTLVPSLIEDSTFIMDSGVGGAYTCGDGGSHEAELNNVDFGDAPIGLSYSSGDGPQSRFDMTGNEAQTDEFDINLFSSFELVSNSAPFDTVTDTDGGVLEARGNTTNGGSPVVLVSGDIERVSDPDLQ